MRVRVLGCSGGIGGELRTTSFLVDDDIALDAGTGLGNLSLEQLARIDHVFLTHSHMDHVACLPFLLDTVGLSRDRPVTLHATAETLDILSEHLFGWKLWPDFRVIPSPERPAVRYAPLRVGETIQLGARAITAVPANHVVPAVGYWMDSGAGSLVFSGDTTVNPALWDIVNKINNLKYLLIETAMSDREYDLAVVSKHLCPTMLKGELAGLSPEVQVYLTHFKPREATLIMDQVTALMPGVDIRMLQQETVFEF